MRNRFVLDTHAIIWILNDPGRLGPAAKALAKAVEGGRAAAFVPEAGLEEIALLWELGRIPIGLAAVRQALQEHQGLVFLAGSLEQLNQYETLGVVSDLFDRRIVAAARSMGAKLVTRDRRLQAAGLIETVWD